MEGRRRRAARSRSLAGALRRSHHWPTSVVSNPPSPPVSKCLWGQFASRGGCRLGGPAPCLGPPARRSIFAVQLGEGAHVDYGLPARTPAATAAATGVGNDGNCLHREPEESASLESFIAALLLVPRAPGQAGLRTCRLGSPIPHGCPTKSAPNGSITTGHVVHTTESH